MRILLLTHSFNSLAQRLFCELRELGHEVSVEFDIHDKVTEGAVESFKPDLLLAPFLKRAIPESVWKNLPCFVIHPGPRGDRGPSALDWAILEGRKEWGVTVLQANAEMDGGDIWATRPFAPREAAKSSVYRNEMTEAAVAAALEAIEKFRTGAKPEPQDMSKPYRPLCKQADRRIDWAKDDSATLLRKIRSADGHPGLLDEIAGEAVYLFDAHPAPGHSGRPGEILGRSGHAIARATKDGAIWIGHLKLKAEHALKLPAMMVLGDRLADLPELADGPAEIGYEEKNGIGYLRFAFHNGAMSTAQCARLAAALAEAKARPTRVLVLTGGPDFWSNGIHLNTIEAEASPADESWRNINAIDDVCREIIETTDKLTIAAIRGNAGAGGVFLALAADLVWAREGAILNPHYKGMGNLYGSEYWTYLLPRRAGEEKARAVTEARLPMGTQEAKRLALIDDSFGRDPDSFMAEAVRRAETLAADPDLARKIADKKRRRAEDEARKPLAQYRAEELARMKLNFYGFDPSYHVARYHFVFKVPKSRTPYYIAGHRAAAPHLGVPSQSAMDCRGRETVGAGGGG